MSRDCARSAHAHVALQRRRVMRVSKHHQWLAVPLIQNPMSSFVSDLRFAVRSLGRAPGFLIVTVLALALGIGATTSIFSVVHGVLLRPLPYPEPERIVDMLQVTPRGGRS